MKEKLFGIELNALCRPQDDFYKYVTSKWCEAHPVPSGRADYGFMAETSERTKNNLRSLIEDVLSKDAAPGTAAHAVCTLYKAMTDMEKRDRDGVGYLVKLLEPFRSAKDGNDLLHASSQIRGKGVPLFFILGSSADPDNSDMNVPSFGPSPLMLMQESYYISEDDTFRTEYVRMATRVLSHLGMEDAEKIAKDAMEIETALAKATPSLESMRDPLSQYFIVRQDDLDAMYPNLHLDRLLQDRGLRGQERVDIQCKSYFDELDRLFGEAPIEKLISYAIVATAMPLSYDTDSYSLDQVRGFYTTTMFGIPEPMPEWKRAISLIGVLMEDEVGRLYVEKYFDDSALAKARSMVENLRKAMARIITRQTWMDPQTKKKALEKLAAMEMKIGHKDFSADELSIEIDPDMSLLEMYLAILSRNSAEDAQWMCGKRDKTIWPGPPQTVNASYILSNNEMWFPSGILQAPYFDPSLLDAMNYGAIGVVMGHEMSHAFDDGGRRYDADGNICDWWSDATDAAFKERAQRIVERFDAVEVLDGLHANGRLTLGENIADLCGLTAAFEAMEEAYKGQEDVMFDGFTKEQAFFISFAYSWASTRTETAIKRCVETDPHSQPWMRTNMTVNCLDAFYDAFDIKPSDGMWLDKDERAVMWD